MRKAFLLLPILACFSAIADGQLTRHQTYVTGVSVGDSIDKVRANLGRPDRTYEIQNNYGGVSGFDYVWDREDGEWTFVVQIDGTIADIWQSKG